MQDRDQYSVSGCIIISMSNNKMCPERREQDVRNKQYYRYDILTQMAGEP